ELAAVLAGVRGDAGQRPPLEQVRLVVQRRDVGQVEAGDREGTAAVQRGEGHRYQLAGRSEQDRGVQRLRRRGVGRARRGGGQGRGKFAGGGGRRQQVHGRPVGDVDLGGQVRGGAEAVDAQPAARRQLRAA